MTKTTFYADSYSHRSDVEFYIAAARRAIEQIEERWRQEHEEQDDRRDEAIEAIEAARALDAAAGQLLNYLVGSARFEHATWEQIGKRLCVSKQAVSERYRHLARIPRRGDVVGTLTHDEGTPGV